MLGPNGRVKTVEIKGSHFFRADGTMFCPFRKKEWSDEKYEEVCAKFEAKRQCMLRNEVEILTEKSPQLLASKEYVESLPNGLGFQKIQPKRKGVR